MKTARMTVLTIICFVMAPALSSPVLAGSMDNSRLIPAEKVAVFEDGEKVAEYTEEMPVPEGALLVATGKCAVKLDDVSFVAEDQSRFAIDSREDNRFLSVQKGTVYFGTAGSGSLVFLTPRGAVSTEQVRLNASSDSRMVEGYVKVTDESSEVGVLDGGSMVLATRDGQQTLKSGQSMLLAQAGEQAQQSDQRPTPAGWWNSLSTVEKVGTAAVAAVGVGGIAYAIFEDDDDEAAASPSSPEFRILRRKNIGRQRISCVAALFMKPLKTPDPANEKLPCLNPYHSRSRCRNLPCRMRQKRTRSANAGQCL